MTDQTLIGHQMKMPDGTITLADLWPEVEVRAVIVGLNPSPKSVDLGHYYQGPVGRRQLRRIADAGIFEPSGFDYYDDAAVAAGIAFADIVKRPTPGEKDVIARELLNGLPALERELEARKVPLVIGVFRHPVEKLLGVKSSQPGLQHEKTTWGAQVFRMPSPYEKLDVVDHYVSELTEVWLGLAR